MAELVSVQRGRPPAAVPRELELELGRASRSLAAAERAVDRRRLELADVVARAQQSGGSVRSIAGVLGVSTSTVVRLLEDAAG